MKKELLKIDCEKYFLENGLQVILYPDHSFPLVSANIWYRVGSANETPGKTGFAHLFEHMMFQGSKNVPKEGHFRYIQEAGGNLNGSTSIDRTNYFETVPANYFELPLWLESDRMGFMAEGLTQEKLDNQKDVVMNERRQSYENQPYGTAWEKLFSNLYPSNHPYSWPTIGWMEDIAKFELEDVKKFFASYYSPSNASLVVAGNFETAKMKSLVQKYFGEIPKGNHVRDIFVPEFQIPATKKIVFEDSVQLPRIYLGFHTTKAFSRDDASLDLLSDILTSSKNARLQKALIFEKQIAQEIFSFQYSGRLDGSFIIVSTAKPGVSLEKIKEEVQKEILDLTQNGISTEELERAKNSLKSAYIFSLQKLDHIADHLNHYNYFLNEPDSFTLDLSRYEAVTNDQIAEAARKYLTAEHIELNIIPKK